MSATDTRRKTIAVDFDGVIADYDGWGDGTPGHPRKDVIEALQTLRTEGWSIFVYSCRSREILEPYLRAHDVPFDQINPPSPYCETSSKPLATVYWDDRALQYSGNAADDLQAIRSFRTWNDRE